MRKTLFAISMLALLVVTSAMTFAQTRGDIADFSEYRFRYNPTTATDTTFDVDVYGRVPLMQYYPTWSVQVFRYGQDSSSSIYEGGRNSRDSFSVNIYGARMDTMRNFTTADVGYVWDSLLNIKDVDTAAASKWPKISSIGDTTYGASVKVVYNAMRARVTVGWSNDDEDGTDRRDSDSTFLVAPLYDIVLRGIRPR